MAEFDDERIASPKQRRKTVILDRFLTFAGLALAGASAFFPWRDKTMPRPWSARALSGRRRMALR